MDHIGSRYQASSTLSLGTSDESTLRGLGRSSRMALLVAVLAEDCDQWVLVEATTAVLGGPLDLGVLDPVVAKGLVTVESSRVRVPHGHVRRTVTAWALPSELQAVHLALAGVLHDDPLASAWHGTLSSGTRDTESAEIALSTARMLQRLGRPGRAREMLENAARLSTTAAARAACLLEAAATTFALGLPAEARKLVEQAERTGLSADLVRLLGCLRVTFSGSTPLTPANSRVDAIEAARTLHGWGLTPVSFSVLLAADGLPVLPDVVAGTAHGAAALEALSALRTGALPDAAQLLAQECEGLAVAGLRGVETHARALLAQTAARTGDLGTALSEVVKARELAWATRQPGWATHAALTEAMLTAMRGEADGARKVADVERLVLAGEYRLRPMVELAHAVVLLSADEWSDAYDVLIELTNRSAGTPELLTAGLLGYLADAALHTGQVMEGRAVVSRTAAASPACTRGAELVDLLYATAILAPHDRSDESFQVLLSLDPGRWPWVRARADLAWGSWLRRGRRVSQARPHLLSAQRLFSAVDAPVWLRRVHTELRAAGVRGTREPAPQDAIVGRLSPQELEIVRLAAQGLSNRQIGDRLFLSSRTIGSHLYRIFPKLDVTSRRQLVGLVSTG